MLPFLGHRSVWWLCLLRFLRLVNMLWVDPQPPRGKSSWECWVLWFHALFQFAKCALFASSWTIRDWWLREKMLAKSWLLGEVTAQTLSKHLPEGLLQHLDGIVLLSTGTSERLLRQGTEGSLFWCTGILKLTCSVFKIHISSEFFKGHFYAWISNFFGTRINQFGFPRASWSTFLALISLPKLLFALEFNISGE